MPGIDHCLDIHTIPVAVSPLATQRAIAAYLDRERLRLDGLGETKESVLGLMAEKRQAFITRAVTRGLDLRPPPRLRHPLVLRDAGALGGGARKFTSSVMNGLGTVETTTRSGPQASRSGFPSRDGKMRHEEGTHRCRPGRNSVQGKPCWQLVFPSMVAAPVAVRVVLLDERRWQVLLEFIIDPS